MPIENTFGHNASTIYRTFDSYTTLSLVIEVYTDQLVVTEGVALTTFFSPVLVTLVTVNKVEVSATSPFVEKYMGFLSIQHLATIPVASDCIH